MIEMTAIIIGIAAPTSVPITSSSAMSAAGRPNCSSPLFRSLSDSSVRSRSSVSPPVMCAAKPWLPFARSTVATRPAIRSSFGPARTTGSGVPVGRHQALVAPVQVAGDLRDVAAATHLCDERADPRGEDGIRDDRALGPHDDDLVDLVLM